MTRRQLQAWAKGGTWYMVSEYTVPWVAAESPFASELAAKWIESKSPHVASSGWATWAAIVTVTPDDELDLDLDAMGIEPVIPDIVIEDVEAASQSGDASDTQAGAATSRRGRSNRKSGRRAG